MRTGQWCCVMAEFRRMNVVFKAARAAGAFSSHSIYCKRHSVRPRHVDEATPPGLTLFSVGWPPYCEAGDVEELFSRAGTVTSAIFQERPGALAGRSGAGGVLQHGGEKSSEGRSGGGRVCYVVFSQPEEVELALRLCSGGEVPCEVGRSGLGLEKWCRQYAASRPKIHNLKNSADKFVGGDIDKKKTQEIVRRRLSQPDKDGWITVARKKPRTMQRPHHRERRKKKQKELLNFYQFQQRETQRQAIADLRRKFEMDKQKVADLRTKRKFKPF